MVNYKKKHRPRITCDGYKRYNLRFNVSYINVKVKFPLI